MISNLEMTCEITKLKFGKEFYKNESKGLWKKFQYFLFSNLFIII